MIQIRHLSWGVKKKQILNDICMELMPGVYGLLGPNGAGKTTLIRCLTGVYTVPAGSILKEGEDIMGAGQYADTLGYLPQKFGLFKGMTVAQMMRYFAEMKKVPKACQEKEIESCLMGVDLKDRAGDRIRTLSGGMIRRLGIAQALLGKPDLIILDEPTAGLDPEERVRFKNLIKDIDSEKIVIIATHIVEDVDDLCDNVVVLESGRILAAGTRDEISGFASGKVWVVPAEQEICLREPYFIAKQDGGFLRVLSDQKQPGKQQKATLEDGYLCKVKGYV